MRAHRAVLALVLILPACAALLFGCSGNDEYTNNGTDPVKEAAEISASKEVPSRDRRKATKPPGPTINTGRSVPSGDNL